MKPLVAVAFCLWSSASFGTEYLDSAKHFLPVCKEAMIYKPKPTATIAWQEGICVGIIRTLMFVGTSLDEDSVFCRPPRATTEDAFGVVTSYIEARPQLLEKNFTGLAIDALRDAWPCKK